MKNLIAALRSDERGLSLLELTVVAAIISILAALTAVAVTGTTSTARTVTRTSDIAELQKAVDRFDAEAAYYPTTTTAAANAAGTEGTDFYQVVEGAAGVNFDVNGDGDTSDTINVVPLNWTATDRDSKAFFPTYVSKKPKESEPASPVTISGAATFNTIPEVWVLDANGKVLLLVSESNY